MRTKIISIVGIAVVAAGLCAWSGSSIAQSGIAASSGRICLISTSATPNVPGLTAAERPDAAAQSSASAQRQKPERVMFSEMMFVNDSDRLSDVGVGRCYLVAQKIRHGINVRVIVQGRSGTGVSSAANHELCLSRAEAVKRQIATFGIAESRMSAVSFNNAAASFKARWVRTVRERAEFEIEAKDSGTSSNHNPEPVDQGTL